MAQATQKHHRPTHQRRAVVFDPKAEIDALIIEPSLVPDLSFLGSVERASSVESPVAADADKDAADNTDSIGPWAHCQSGHFCYGLTRNEPSFELGGDGSGFPETARQLPPAEAGAVRLRRGLR